MKKWRETQAVLQQLERLQAAGMSAALATVVRMRGSAYRREGAKLLVAEDGSTVGNVSGGCLEQDVKASALEVLKAQRPRLRKYCSGPDDIGAWDMGLGCDGQVEIFVEPVMSRWPPVTPLLDEDEWFALCSRLPSGDGGDWHPGRLIVRPAGAREAHAGSLGAAALDATTMDLAAACLRQGRPSALHEVAGQSVFIDVFEPPPRLVLIGAGEDARVLSQLASMAGFGVTVIDRRPALLAPERFAAAVRRLHADAQDPALRAALHDRCHVVVMTHNYADDRQYLQALLPTAVPYIGLLGPRQRSARLLEHLGINRPADLQRIHAPVGLDLGGEGAEQVALSIVSEVLAVHAGRQARSLRERRHAIHARAV